MILLKKDSLEKMRQIILFRTARTLINQPTDDFANYSKQSIYIMYHREQLKE